MPLDEAIQQLKSGGGLDVAPPPLQLAGLSPPKLDLPPLRSAPDPLSASSAGVPGAQITGTSIHINTEMASKVNQLIADAPPAIRAELSAAVTSGYRDMAQQEAAYRNYQQGGGLAAPPGHSQHQMWGGMAVDWNAIENQSPAAKQYLLQNAGKYGLEFPLGSQDPWHMQMVGQTTHTGGGQPNDTDHRRPPSPFTQTPAPAPSDELQTFGQVAAAKYGVPWNIFYWAIQGESSWNPNIGASSAGAQGIAQFVPDTARQYGVNVSDPRSSLDGAARYLATLYKQSGSWTGALTGYLTGDPSRSPPLDVIEQNAAYRTAFANAGFTTTDAIGQRGMETVQEGYRTKARHADEAFRLAVEQINASDKNLDRAMERIRAARDKADAAQDEALKALKGQPKAPVLDGVQHMNSIAVIVGLLGGLMTKAPMLASTNAAAAAIEAYNAGDLRAFNIAHSLWKENTDYLFKIADMQSNRVRDIASDEKMGLDEKRAKLDATLRAMGLQEIADQARIDGPKAAMDWALQMQKYRDDHERYMQERDKPQVIYDQDEKKWYNWYPLSNRKEPIPGTPQTAVLPGLRQRQDLTADDRAQVERDLQAWLQTDEGAKASQTDIENKRYDLGNELMRKKGALKRDEYDRAQPVQVQNEKGEPIWPPGGGYANASRRKDGKGWIDSSGNPLPEGVVRDQRGQRATSGAMQDENAYTDAYVADKVAQLGHPPTAGELARLRIEGRAEAKNTMRGIGVISDEAATLMAQQMILGDKAGLAQLPRGGASRIKVENRFAELLKEQGDDAARAVVMNRLRMLEAESAARTAGRVTMQTELFAQEATDAGAEVIRTSKLVPRTDEPMFNRAIEAYLRNTGDPNIIQFGAALNALVNAYGKMSNPTGTGIHDADKERLAHTIDTSLSQDQIEGGVNQIITEGRIISNAAHSAQQSVLPGLAPSGVGPGANAPRTQMPTVTNQAEYDALPPGTPYQDAQGNRYTKGK
jgi:hypothetical protein